MFELIKISAARAKTESCRVLRVGSRDAKRGTRPDYASKYFETPVEVNHQVAQDACSRSSPS